MKSLKQHSVLVKPVSLKSGHVRTFGAVVWSVDVTSWCIRRKTKGNGGETGAHAAIGALKRNSWLMQRREFKEECLKN